MLEDFTTEELLTELLTRTTFQGVIVRRNGSYKFDKPGPQPFLVHRANFTREEAIRVLNQTAERMKDKDLFD